ncbi:MAG: hypothetical protein RL219_1765 [Actinomycetota bacterium]
MSEQPSPTSPGGGLFAGLGERISEAEAKTQRPTMNMAELLELPDDQRRVVRHLLRADTPPTAEECAAALDITLDQLNELLGQLTLIGLVEIVSGRLRAIAGWRSSRLPPGGVWSSLGNL